MTSSIGALRLAHRGDWRRAYGLFVDLEERLARAQRARGLPALG